MHLKEKICKLSTLLSATELIFFFHKHKLAIEVVELGHAHRNLNNEIQRQKSLERELDCVFIRINPAKKDFNIFKDINKIHRHINQKVTN